MLTVERLKEVLHYNPRTGIWTWTGVIRGTHKGEIAGSMYRGYVRIMIDGKSYFNHRLAWLWMTGEWPLLEVDHRDTNRANCRWKNLRETTHLHNCANRNKKVNNRSGHKGVHFCKKAKKYRSQITVNGKRQCLGWFPSPKKAAAAYNEAAALYFGEFARTRPLTPPRLGSPPSG